jgi:thymidylate kinase
MVFVVEGVDRSGKTTFCKKLAEKINGVIIRVDKDTEVINKQIKRMGIKTPDFYDDVIIAGVLFSIKPDKHIIFDRSLISADIYRRVRGEKYVDNDILNWWIQRISEIGFIYIWFDSELSFIRKVMDGLKEMPRYDNNDYGYIIGWFRRYYNWFNDNGFKCVKITRTIEDYEPKIYDGMVESEVNIIEKLIK